MKNFNNSCVYIILYNGGIYEVWDDALMARKRLEELKKRLKEKTTFWRRLHLGFLGKKDNLRLRCFEVNPTGEF